MECQILFSRKNKKHVIIFPLLNLAIAWLSANARFHFCHVHSFIHSVQGNDNKTDRRVKS